MNLLILDRKKYIPALILCLTVLICMTIVVIFNSSSDSETTLPGTCSLSEIGRASCRERV